MEPPAHAYELLLTGEGTKLSFGHHPVLSHCIGRRGLKLPFWWGRPLGLVTYLGVDRLGPWWTGSFMENPVPIRRTYLKSE
jgi:hypothetical protein